MCCRSEASFSTGSIAFFFLPFSHYEREVEGTLLDVRRSKGEQDDTKEK